MTMSLSLQHPSLYRSSLILLLAVCLALSSCGRGKSSAVQSGPVDAPIAQRGNWFCQPAAPGASDPWECVQDAELAKNPKPDRLPDASPEPPLPGTESSIEDLDGPLTPGASGATLPSPGSAAGP